MCGIAGVLSKDGANVAPVVAMMLSRMAKRGPDGAGLATEESIVRLGSVQALAAASVRGTSVLGHSRLAIVGGTCGSQPFRSCDGRLTVEHNGEIYNYKELRKELEGRHRFTTDTDSEVIAHLLEENRHGNDFLAAIKKTAARLDGIYALAIRDERTGTIALVRDTVGVRPMYYGENDRLVAFASERKGLWEAGIKEPTRRVLPGHALLISSDGKLSQVPVASVPAVNAAPSITMMDAAVDAYEKVLVRSMEKRTQDIERIGIIFSGGIDSVLVAYLASKMVPEVVCYTAGMEGSSDIDHAKEIAGRLGLELHAKELTQAEVERLVPEIIDVIEDSNAGQVEVAIPVYCAIQLAARQGMRIMLTGQGADELFGGYSWYSRIAAREGYDVLRRRMADDLMLLYKETLEREDKISMAHSVEMREPFLDRDVIATSMDIDLHLNVRKGDLYGKRVHRRTAQKLGIPKDIAFRPKEAAQHGSGVHAAIDAIARYNGFSEESVTAGYLQALASKEKVGSSQRYGYLFEKEQKMWIAEPYVQMYLDSLARLSTPRFGA
ncbi:MAG: asparagine synthase (glutamine-hydrolyzing) [Nitrososphaera sp.]|jgi:asparagine synthase (glutamine-hydrolysing)